jgi:predicted DNA-binding protein (MmcQ/YjbR family)
MPRGQSRPKGAEAELRRFALGLPEAYEEFPWGERAIKVKGKVFVFMYTSRDGFSMSTKLPDTGAAAVTLPFASPTGYGLGKSGWVSARFGPSAKPPTDLLKMWIRESYQAIAPKKLVALQAASAAPALAPKRSLRSAR